MRNRWLGEDPNDVLEDEATREAELANAQQEIAYIEQMEEMFDTEAWFHFAADLSDRVNTAKNALASDITVDQSNKERGTIRAFQYSLARPAVLATRKRDLLETVRELGESQ